MFPDLHTVKNLVKLSEAPCIAGFNLSKASIPTSCIALDTFNNPFLVVSSIALAIFSERPVASFRFSQYILKSLSLIAQISSTTLRASPKPNCSKDAFLASSDIPP